MTPASLQAALEQLQDAAIQHSGWRDHVLRVVSGRRPCDPEDLEPDAHRRCLFGQWYFEQSLPALRSLPSFAMIGAEHADQHRIAAGLLAARAAGAPVDRTQVEHFEEASSRLSYALYFIQREIECALHSRDTLTDAHSAGEMMRDLREWHALVRHRAQRCCIALMELDAVRDGPTGRDLAADAQVQGSAVRIVTAHLRLSDKVFRHDASKFLVRLSGTDLEPGKTVVQRLKGAVAHGLTATRSDGTTVPVTVSFGIAMLDPAVEAMESVDRADQALMLARATGRNRVIVWDPSVTTGVRLRRLDLKDLPG